MVVRKSSTWEVLEQIYFMSGKNMDSKKGSVLCIKEGGGGGAITSNEEEPTMSLVLKYSCMHCMAAAAA